MGRAIPFLIVGVLILAFSNCSTASLTVEEKLQLLTENYEGFIAKVMTTLEATASRGEAMQVRLEELELKVKEQESLLMALRTESSSKSVSNAEGIEKSLSTGKNAIFRTCRETRAADPFLGSGMYWIDPDGQAVGDDPIYVYCDMTKGSTSILHDSESQMDVGHCADPGCYSRAVNYNATMRQMKTLADLSSECHQSIRYDCNYAPLEYDGVAYSWWNDKDGKAQYFWAGNNSSIHTCQCGIDHNCVEVNRLCNCVSAFPLPQTDSGIITDKDILPITRLNFGRTLLESSSGVHTLGRFECSGQVAVPVADSMPTSCRDLMAMGHFLGGFYSVMGTKQLESVYCDFAKQPSDPGYQTWVGYMDVKSSPVYFYVQKNLTLATFTNSPITFEIERLNIGSAMDLSLGIFIAPRNGIYFFSFSGIANAPLSSGRLEFGSHMYHNGYRIGSAWADATPIDDGEFETFSLQSTMNLLAGDQIWMQITRLDTGVSLFDNFNCHTHFTGLLLEEDIFQSQNIMV